MSAVDRCQNKDRGVTLVVTLVMLVIMTLLAIAAIRMSTNNLKIVGNMQLQKEVLNAAQSAINQVLSSGAYLTKPSTAPSTITVGNYSVAIVKPCLKSAVVLFDSDFSNPPSLDDQKCKTSSKYDPANLGGMSDCSRVTFQVTANVTDASTNAKATIVQGASMRMDRVLANAYKNDPAMVCP